MGRHHLFLLRGMGLRRSRGRLRSMGAPLRLVPVMNPLDRAMWACVEFCAARCTTAAFALSLLAAIAAVGLFDGAF